MSIHSFYVRVGAQGRAALHTHDNHEWYFCLDGRCTQLAGTDQFTMRPGDLCLLPEGVPHFAYAHGPEGSGAWVINVREDFFSPHQEGDREALEIMKCLCARARARAYQLPLSEAGRKTVRAAVATMVDETVARDVGWLAIVKAELIQLLTGLYRQWPGADRPPISLSSTGGQERMRTVFAYIENNYMNPLQVEDLLALAHLSRSHFHAVFATEAECTFKEYLNRIRVRRAEDLLRGTDLPIAQIALGCGFSCLSHFYAVFKQYTKKSPRRARTGGGE